MSRLIRRTVTITITESWTIVWATKDENADQSTTHLHAQRKEQPMNEPIYRFFRGRYTNAWYQLTQQEKDQLFAEMGQAFQASGGKTVVPACTTCWSSDWQVFGVEVYPSLEAVQKWREAMARIGCFQYLEIESMIGIQQAS